MESFGRTIAFFVGIIGVVFLLFFSKMVSARWQRHETIRSISHAFAETLLQEKSIVINEWEAFRKELYHLGGYRAELLVYERRRFEDENGVFFLYEKAEITGDKILKAGSYVRVLVTKDGSGETFLMGDCGIILVGGLVL